MEIYLQSEIMKALWAGDMMKFMSYLAIFFLIWQQVRQLKKEVMKLNETIGNSLTSNETKFKDGELRFEKVEKTQLEFEHRLTLLEQLKSQGGTAT